MSALHTQGRVTFKEDGDANHYSMLTEDGRWWLAVLANGEQTSERQIANFRRLAACWNACEGISTEYLETTGLPEFAGKTLCADMVQAELDAMTKQRDQLQQLVDAQVQDIGNGMSALFILREQNRRMLAALEKAKPALEMYRAYGWDDRAGVIRDVNAAIEVVKGGQCQTCNGHGMVGGPSFREPDEGGEPCPDCQQPALAVPVGCIPVPAEWINGLLLGDRQHHNELRAMLAAAQEGGA